MNKRTEITVETHRLLVIRRRNSPFRYWCTRCQTGVGMITPGRAAHAASVSTRTIYQWIEDGVLHFLEDSQGGILICTNSLKTSESATSGLNEKEVFSSCKF